VAVRRELVRHGSGEASGRLHEIFLDGPDQQALAHAAARADADLERYQPLPVHPWQYERVLPVEFAGEIASRDVVFLDVSIGRFHPTASLRTLTTSPEGAFHVKLPLGVATLGATRRLPPRYLDNGERAEATMRAVVARDPVLSARVGICDETTWAGWRGADDELADRPGDLCAQVRAYPGDLAGSGRHLLIPMGAFGAHRWDVLSAVFGAARTDPVEFFGVLADAFTELGLSFLRYGVLPELHGQNVVAVYEDGVPTRFVLRDHDTLRLYPAWMTQAGIPDPGYRIKPGAPQSLCLGSGAELLAYLQTLGFQVNLYGIADALSRARRVDEALFWRRLRSAAERALDRLALPGHVAEVVERGLLRQQTWPCRLILGPLLRRGRSGQVSMPAGVGTVPNPLLTHVGVVP
jgi:staphyloferrin B synthase